MEDNENKTLDMEQLEKVNGGNEVEQKRIQAY